MSPLLKYFLITYSSLEGWFPRGLCAARAPSKAGPSGGDFFSRLETLVSGSSEVVLFLPRGERMSDSSPWLSSLTEAPVPSVRIGSSGSPLSPSFYSLLTWPAVSLILGSTGLQLYVFSMFFFVPNKYLLFQTCCLFIEIPLTSSSNCKRFVSAHRQILYTTSLFKKRIIYNS